MGGDVYSWDLETGLASEVLYGHEAAITAIVAAPGGDAFASSDLDGTVRVWRLSDGATTATFHDHEDQVSGLGWLPGRGEIASGSADGTVRIWDTATARARIVLDTGPQGTRSLAIAPDGERLVTGGWDRGVHVFDLRTATKVHSLFGHVGRVSALALSPSGRYAVSGSEDATLRIWDLTEFRECVVLEGHAREVESVAFAPHGAMVVSSSSDGTVRIWDFHRARSIAESKDQPETSRFVQIGEWRAALAHPQSDEIPLEARAECELGAEVLLAAHRTVDQILNVEPHALRWRLLSHALDRDVVICNTGASRGRARRPRDARATADRAAMALAARYAWNNTAAPRRCCSRRTNRELPARAWSGCGRAYAGRLDAAARGDGELLAGR